MFWSQSGLTRSCNHDEGSMHPKSKMVISKFQGFSRLSTQIWILSQILLEFYYKYGIFMHNRGLYIHYSRWEGIKVSINLDFNN